MDVTIHFVQRFSYEVFQLVFSLNTMNIISLLDMYDQKCCYLLYP